MSKLITLYFLMYGLIFSQNIKIPLYYQIDTTLSNELHKIVHDLELDGDFDAGEDGLEQISLAVIDLTSEKPQLGGVNIGNFIYPASVYKMYVAAEILNHISKGELSLTSTYITKFPNIVDKSKEITFDPRPLLQEGDMVTVNYLLDLMMTRSDNSAANCLIDIAKRENINKFMHTYNWQGSEVTRKFLKRKYEDPGYETIRGTETCALHAADFLYRIETNQLINPWLSMQIKVLLGRQLDKSKLATGLPPNAMLYHKTGWFSYWTHDVGIVDDGRVHYIIACFLPLKEELARVKFPELSRRIFMLINQRLN
ncbi:serine hydrolase [candidate division KSB1 bacterium]|nr:serine hydrolase [candidate division KSB1 bacterium]